MMIRASRRPTSSRLRWLAGTLLVAFAALAAPACTPAFAQTNLLKFPPPPPKPKPQAAKLTAPNGQPQMLIQANEMRYDYTNERVSAVGNVQMYYNGSTVEADRITYDQRTKRLRAEGNVRLTEPDGKITYGEILDLNDDYRDGFVDSLRLDAPNATRFAAARADRSNGNWTVLQSGVYTACKACAEDPKKPPLWQVKAARIIHNEGEKMIYFENASLELFGMPIAYFPYFSAPDPTVKRKSGFLMPLFTSSSVYGFGVEIPYYMALAPDYDLTISPFFTTKQGVLLQGEFRQRLANGAWMIRGTGINQLDKNDFQVGSPAYRDWRGSIETSGQFAINDKWTWGWDALLLSDRTYFQDYNVSAKKNTGDPFQDNRTAGVSQIYLTGRGDRSYFDVRAIHYLGLSTFDRQSELPVIHPVLDYSYVFGKPVLEGELSYKVNITSLSRDNASFEPITAVGITNNLCSPTTNIANVGAKMPANCLLRGVPGEYSRASAQVDWRRTITDAYGQIFTPFASVRVDAMQMSIINEPGVSNFIEPGSSSLARVMPTVGLEYRYPFINVQSWGTQTIEPIVQVIARPNESNIGKVPNEDAQSLMFDDSNLFKVDKFSGWDRQEGGGRSNVGVQYTAQFNRGGFVNVLFGQSYQLFGENSFAVGDITNTGLNSGLDKSRSDYVARVSYQPDRVHTFTTRYRFDEATMNIRRFEAEAKTTYDRWSFSLLYGNYDAQPELGFLTRRQGVLGSTSVKVAQNWVAQTAARYNIEMGKFDQTMIGVGYVDDCLILALNYITSYNYNQTTTLNAPTIDHRIMLQLSLRTLGGTSLSQGVSGLPGGL
ncbi:MAG TPA: LPS-assembly protein LptD [Pseudorhodoplanes sp.]|jgi:LPS-assembly protein|nr:LPS-assembly protein LptD [Pseudorhodoplanes sp.]